MVNQSGEARRLCLSRLHDHHRWVANYAARCIMFAAWCVHVNRVRDVPLIMAALERRVSKMLALVIVDFVPPKIGSSAICLSRAPWVIRAVENSGWMWLRK